MCCPLLRRFPGLALPRVPLAARRAPVSRAGGAWFKREDLVADDYAGNKVRKLEWLLGAARARGAAEVLTVGAAGSHHVLATAVHARRAGLAVRALLLPHPASAHAADNLRAAAACAALHACPAAAALPACIAAAAVAGFRATGRAPAWVPPGGSSALGALGAVDLGLEIAEDVAAGRLPEPGAVYVPLGSAGTAAGLLLGLRLGGLSSEVVAVRVVSPLLSPRRRVLRLARAAARRLPGAPAVRLDGLRVEGGQLGAGYGRPTPAAEAAVAWAAEHLGAALETTYSGKALAAMLADLRAGRAGPDPLLVVTVNGRPLAPLLSGAPPPPERLRRLLRP